VLVVLRSTEEWPAPLWLVFLALKQAVQAPPQDVEALPVQVEPQPVWVVLALRLALWPSLRLLNRLQVLLLTLMHLMLLMQALIEWFPLSPPPPCGLHCCNLWLHNWGPWVEEVRKGLQVLLVEVALRLLHQQPSRLPSGLQVLLTEVVPSRPVLLVGVAPLGLQALLAEVVP